VPDPEFSDLARLDPEITNHATLDQTQSLDPDLTASGLIDH